MIFVPPAVGKSPTSMEARGVFTGESIVLSVVVGKTRDAETGAHLWDHGNGKVNID